MSFTFLDQQVVLEWPAQPVDPPGAYRQTTSLAALAVTGDGSIVISDIVLNQAGLEMGHLGWWTDLRVITPGGVVLHPNIYQSTHYRNAVAMAAGEVSPGVVGILVWEAQEAISSEGHWLPLERMLFFRVAAATGELLGVTIHPAVFDPPGAVYRLYPIDRGMWGAVCEQVGSTVTFRFRVGAWEPGQGSTWYAAEFVPDSSGGLDYVLKPWPEPLDGDPDRLVSCWAHGAGLGDEGRRLVEVDQDAVEVPGSSVLLPAPVRSPGNRYMEPCMARQINGPLLYLVRGYWWSSGYMWFEMLTASTTAHSTEPASWWEGSLQDDGWSPAWGSGTLPEAIIPSLPGDGTVVITNPADPDDPWAWATLPPGAGQNDWMAFYVDGDWVQVHYGGRVVLVWRMPPSVYQHFLSGGASMGFYNSYTKEWQAEPPPGWPPAKPAPLDGWAYLVDSRHRVPETGDLLTRYGTRIDADDVLVFPGDYALVGQALQDDVIQSAPIKHIAGRDLPEVVLSRDDALLVWDAGYGHYLYPVEEAA